MSKMCCGIVYGNSDKYCQMCGKEIVETDEITTQVDEVLDSAFVPNEFEAETSILTSEYKMEAVNEEISKEANNQTEVMYQQPNPNGMYQQPNPNRMYQQPNPNGMYQQPNPNGMYQQPNPNGMYQQPNPNIINQQQVQQPSTKKQQDQNKKVLKIVSIVTLSIAVVGLVITLVCSYLFWINPSYKDYEGAAKKYEKNVDSVENDL